MFQVPKEGSAMFPQFQVSVLDLPRMESKIVGGSSLNSSTVSSKHLRTKT
jgi:hypothetical protein